MSEDKRQIVKITQVIYLKSQFFKVVSSFFQLRRKTKQSGSDKNINMLKTEQHILLPVLQRHSESKSPTRRFHIPK